MVIHCIGDSHTSIFSGYDKMIDIYPSDNKCKLENFKPYRIGAVSASHVKNRLDVIGRIVNENYKNGDMILFCFGEIDCRMFFPTKIEYLKEDHIITDINGEYIIQNKKNEFEIIEKVVNRYFNILYENFSKYNISFWGPVASFREDLIDPKHMDGLYNINYTCQQRNNITKIFNDVLKKLCEEKNIKFFTFFYDMVDENLITKFEMTDGIIHLNSSIVPLILKKFENIKNI